MVISIPKTCFIPLLTLPGPVTGTILAVGSHDESKPNTPNSEQREQPTSLIANHALQDPSTPDPSSILPELTLHHENSSLLQLTNAALFDGESEPIPTTRTPRPVGLHVSRSSPGLSTQFTAKLSNTFFNNDTVVHRPKLSSRPSVQTTYFKDPDCAQQEERNSYDRVSDVPSLPSQIQSAPGSSNAPLSQSTAPTSFVSSGALVSAETTQRNNDSGHVINRISPEFETPADRSRSSWLVFPRQDAPRLSKPSVTTLENASAAKVFFEAHFNDLLGPNPTPRSMRRRNTERKLFAMALPNAQRQQQRKAWHVAESNHLRQTRVLKSKTLVRKQIKGVHVSHYDVVRVLGKGSFGIVRLVREKSEHESSSGSDGYRIDNIDGTSIRGIESLTPPVRKTKKVFAMKVIRKSDMLRNSQEGHLRAERDFLVASENSRWVVPLMAAFQDNTNLYLVMEYMVGGDFLGLLLREDILDESVAR